MAIQGRRWFANDLGQGVVRIWCRSRRARSSKDSTLVGKLCRIVVGKLHGIVRLEDSMIKGERSHNRVCSFSLMAKIRFSIVARVEQREFPKMTEKIFVASDNDAGCWRFLVRFSYGKRQKLLCNTDSDSYT